MSTYVENQLMVAEVCWAREGCGIQFAMPAHFAELARTQGLTFHCPRGHRLRYGNSEVDELRDRLETAKKTTEFWRDQTQRAERRVAAQKGVTTRLKKRVSNGVCPCCKRHFANVERHIKGQHPDFASPEGAEQPVVERRS